MIRQNFYLTNDQVRLLKSLGVITMSEHIRRAIDEYIERIKPNMHITTSPSKKGEVWTSPVASAPL